MASESRLGAGRVGKSHGLDGSFYVTRPRAALLVLGAKVTLGDSGTEAEIVRRSGTDEHPILRLTGVTTREAVAALRGTDLFVARAAAPALGEDEWWAEDFAGCRVTDGDREVGVVKQMRALPSCEVLEVERSGRDDLLVPLVRDAVRSVDPAARHIDVDLAFLGEDEAS